MADIKTNSEVEPAEINESDSPVGGIEPVKISYCIITQRFRWVVAASNLRKLTNKFVFSSLLLIIKFSHEKNFYCSLSSMSLIYQTSINIFLNLCFQIQST